MSLLLKVERAFANWLRGQAGQLITGHGSYIIEEHCIRVRLSSGIEFMFPVLRGQEDVERVAPCVVAYCPSGTPTELCSLTSFVEVEVALYVPADEKAGMTAMLDLFAHAAEKLGEALMRSDLLDRLNESEPEFTVLHRPEPWTQESGWTDRMRTYRYRTRLVVAPANLHNPS